MFLLKMLEPQMTAIQMTSIQPSPIATSSIETSLWPMRAVIGVRFSVLLRSRSHVPQLQRHAQDSLILRKCPRDKRTRVDIAAPRLI
jgi:hypothetical protein